MGTPTFYFRAGDRARVARIPRLRQIAAGDSRLKKIFIGLLVIILAFLGFAATRPSEFAVERSISIASAPQTVFPLINDFHNWTMWSPWEGLDPAMKRTYGNVSAGTGAEYSWVGNDKVGEGKMTILESKPDSLVKIKLEFIKPFEETSETTFTIAPQGPNTQVTWRRAGHNNFIAKVMSVFMDFEKMIGGDFDKGLGNLKGAAEKGAAPPSDTGPAPGETTAPPSGAPTPPGPSPTSN